MNFNAFRIGMVLFFIVPQLLSAAVHPATAAPTSPKRVITNHVDGLDGDADADFWSVGYFDTNGSGDANDPKAYMANPPVGMDGYGTGAMLMEPGDASGGSGCSGLGGQVFFGTTELAGIKLKDINTLTYSFLVDSTNGSPEAGQLGVYVRLFVDRNGDGAWVDGQDSILVYNPIYTLASIPQDTWLTNNVVGLGALGEWHVEGQPILGLGLGIPLLDSLFNQILLLPALGLGIDPLALTIGDLKIVNPPACQGIGGLTWVVGSLDGEDWDDFVAFLDGIDLNVGGSAALDLSIDLNIIGDPVTATVLSGDGQIVSLGGLLAPIVVELRDENGLLADIGTIATIELPLSGPSVLFPGLIGQVVDASGTVTFIGGIVNQIIGDYLITIISGTTEVVIDLFNSNADDIALSLGDDQTATINNAYQHALAVIVTDPNGDPLSDVTVNFSAPDSGASVTFPSGNTTETDENGIASVSVVANGEVGMFGVVATTVELPEDSVHFALGNNPMMPNAVTTLSAASMSATAIQLTWGSTSMAAYDTYTVYRSSDGVNFSPVTTLPHGSTGFMDSGLVCQVNYTYRVDVGNMMGTMTGETASAPTGDCQELLVNGSFNVDSAAPRRVPSGWKGVRMQNDRQNCKNLTKSFDGACHMVFKPRAVNTNGFLMQTINVNNIVAGQALTLTANAWNRKGAKGTIEMIIVYADNSRTRHQLRWQQNSTSYVNQSVNYTLINNPVKIIVRVRGRVNRGLWLVDGVSLKVNNIGAMRLP